MRAYKHGYRNSKNLCTHYNISETIMKCCLQIGNNTYNITVVFVSIVSEEISEFKMLMRLINNVQRTCVRTSTI